MGAAASALPESMDAKAAETLCGEHWDKAAYDAAAEENFITGEVTISRAAVLAHARAKGLNVAVETSAEVLLKARRMTVEDKAEAAATVLEAALKRESVRRQAAFAAKPADYSKGFSGSAEDTKNEREAAAILRGDDKKEEVTDSLLVPVTGLSPAELNELEGLGTWLKLLGGAGCYLYIHSLTREVRSTRPSDCVEPLIEQGAVDAFNGLPNVPLVGLMDEVRRIILEEKKTPLILDGSEDRKVATFFRFKGVLIDFSPLSLPLRDKLRPKPKACMEEARSKAVQGMKTGAAVALELGDCDGAKANLEQLCKREGFRKEIFLEGGAGLLRNKMAFKQMYSETEKEHGECIARDGFLFVCITALPPQTFQKELQGGIPLDWCYPIVCLAES
mmetsp:Transcript_11719/g.39170  ORF Transcript_11719/g.39170 Transcript_11719/m.39170 type:complete len:391 (+) Transcript_11719:174-1346(+)